MGDKEVSVQPKLVAERLVAYAALVSGIRRFGSCIRSRHAHAMCLVAMCPVLLLSLVRDIAYVAVEIEVVQVRQLLVLPSLRFWALHFVNVFAVVYKELSGPVLPFARSAIAVYIIPVGQNVCMYNGRRVAS